MPVVPDVSLGTHFFNDLVEANMLYLAVHPTRRGDSLNLKFLAGARNRLAELLPEDAEWAGVVRVIDFPDAGRRAASVPERRLLPPARRLLPCSRGKRIVTFGCGAQGTPFVNRTYGKHARLAHRPPESVPRSRHSRPAASAPASFPSLVVPQWVRLGRAPRRMRRIDPLGARPLRERNPGGRPHCAPRFSYGGGTPAARSSYWGAPPGSCSLRYLAVFMKRNTKVLPPGGGIGSPARIRAVAAPRGKPGG